MGARQLGIETVPAQHLETICRTVTWCGDSGSDRATSRLGLVFGVS